MGGGLHDAAAAALAAWAWLASPFDRPPAPRAATVAAVLDQTDVRIGEPVMLSIVVEGLPASAAIGPRVGATIGAFEVLGIDAGQPGLFFARSGGQRTWAILLTSFEAGTHTIPSLRFDAELRDGRLMDSLATTPLTLRVSAPDVGPETPFRPLRPAIELPPSPWSWPLTLALALVSAGAAGAALTLRRLAAQSLAQWRRRRRWLRLRRCLEALARTRSRDRAQARLKYYGAAGVFRQALEDLLGETVGAATTSELVRRMAAGFQTEGLPGNLGEMLGLVDRLRFGGEMPSPDVERRVLAIALKALNALADLARRDRAAVR